MMSPFFLWKTGWGAPRGPYLSAAALRQEGDEAARRHPGEVIHVLGSLATVQTPPPEPLWDGELPAAFYSPAP